MERLYSIPSWQLAIALFVILLGGMFGGFLLGKNAARRGEQEAGAADSAAASIFAFNGGVGHGHRNQKRLSRFFPDLFSGAVPHSLLVPYRGRKKHLF